MAFFIRWLLQHWTVYNRAWPLSSHGCRWINWNWRPDGTEFLLIENERQRSKDLSVFPIEIFGVETNPAKFWAIFDLLHTYICDLQLSFYHILDLRRIRRYVDPDTLVNGNLSKNYHSCIVFGMNYLIKLLITIMVTFATECKIIMDGSKFPVFLTSDSYTTST